SSRPVAASTTIATFDSSPNNSGQRFSSQASQKYGSRLRFCQPSMTKCLPSGVGGGSVKAVRKLCASVGIASPLRSSRTKRGFLPLSSSKKRPDSPANRVMPGPTLSQRFRPVATSYIANVCTSSPYQFKKSALSGENSPALGDAIASQSSWPVSAFSKITLPV